LTASAWLTQSRGVFRAYVIAVRLAYLSAVVAAALIGGWTLVTTAGSTSSGISMIRYASAFEMMWYGFIIASVMCAARAITRPLRKISFLPESHLREMPAVATIVATCAVFADWLVFNLVLGLLQTLPDDADGNFAGPSLLALMLYTIALLTGEIVLVGRGGARLPSGHAGT
jgi:hypothetical protein